MKLILYIISVLLLFYCVSAGGSPTKQDVDISELQTDANLEDALHYGINWIFKQAALKSGISGLVMGITKVNKIQKWKQGGSTYYYFDVEAANDDVNITSVYNVKCDSKGVLSVVSKWSYNIGKKDDKPDKNMNIPEEEGHKNRCKEGKEVDASQIEKDEHLKDVLNFGINWIFEKAAEKFNIYESDIEINKVNILCKWEENGNIHYYFDVEAANSDNITLNATYNVKCDPEGNLIVVNKWHYNVHFNGKCKEVEVVEIEKDSQLKNALIYGITRIFHKATRKFGISDLGIVVTKVNSMCSYKGIGDTYYSFDAEAINDHGDIVYTSYKVKYESKTRNLRAVDEWKYNIQYNHQEELTNDYEDQGNHNIHDDKYDMEPHVPLKVEIELNLY